MACSQRHGPHALCFQTQEARDGRRQRGTPQRNLGGDTWGGGGARDDTAAGALGGTTVRAHLGAALEPEDEITPAAYRHHRRPAVGGGSAGEGAFNHHVMAMEITVTVLRSMDAAALIELRDRLMTIVACLVRIFSICNCRPIFAAGRCGQARTVPLQECS